jgi:hypothetical protein
MGIISDAVHIFFDSLSIVVGLVSVVVPLKRKIFRTSIRMFLLDDLLKLNHKHNPVCIIVFNGFGDVP